MLVSKFDEDSYNLTVNWQTIERIEGALEFQKNEATEWTEADEALLQNLKNTMDHFRSN
jgi:hypothetical protein